MNEGLRTCGKPSRGRYVQGCRCYACRVANAEYALAHAHGVNERKMLGKKSADALRFRVRALLSRGWTKRGICRESGVARSTLATLLGGHANTPTKRGGEKKRTCKVSAEAYRRIMALPMEPNGRHAGGELVDAKPLKVAIAALEAEGHTRYEIAEKSGIPLGSVYSLGKGEKCTYRTMQRLARGAVKMKGGAR